MDKLHNRSQSSAEYLVIVALTFLLLIPTAYLFYSYSKSSSQEIKDSQVTKIGRSIVDSAQSIFHSGLGSKVVLELNIPDNVDSVAIIDGKELVFNLSTDLGVSEIVFFSAVNITTISTNCIINVCSIPELATVGLKKVKIEAISKENVKIETI